ncbi:hypothetical protein U91I_02164 [alpha proteobacterium U9-1i]|nr:hypothetical protein U91I_02164 [alpha proteobacterium U9-1i]
MSKTILIVGASPAARVLLPALLRNWPCTIINAPDALSAIHVADRLRVHALIAVAAQAKIGATDLREFAARSPRLADTAIHVLARTGGATSLSDLVLQNAPMLEAPTPIDPVAALPALIAQLDAVLTP